MKRKRIGKKAYSSANLQSLVMNAVVPGTAGYIAGEVLDKQLTILAKNNTVAALVKVGGGMALSMFVDGFLGKMGVGLAVSGAVSLALPALEKAGIASINLLPPGQRSYYITGTPGTAVRQPEAVTMQ